MPIHQPKLPQNPVMQEAGKRLRNEMTREERHLWYDFLRAFVQDFIGSIRLEAISLTFIAQRHVLL